MIVKLRYCKIHYVKEQLHWTAVSTIEVSSAMLRTMNQTICKYYFKPQNTSKPFHYSRALFKRNENFKKNNNNAPLAQRGPDRRLTDFPIG